MTPRTLRLAAFGLLCASLAGCARFEFNPAVYTQKKLALVTYFGNKQVNAATGSIGSTQGAASEWGTDFLTPYFPEGVRAVQTALGGEFIDAAQVAAAPSYGALEGPSFTFNQLAAPGLKAINVASPDLAALGRLGAELRVDAVVLVQHEWAILTEGEAQRQYCNDKYRLLIVGADGTKLWDQVGNAEGRPGLSVKQALSETAGSVSPDSVQQMIRNATVLAHDAMAERWKEHRP